MKRSSALILVGALVAAPPLNAGCGDTTSNKESSASGGSGGSISSTAPSSTTTTGSTASGSGSATQASLSAVGSGGGASSQSTGAGGVTSAASTGDGGAGAPGGVCVQVSGDYGDCEVALGWGFDGERCQSYSGCSCEPDCDRLFDTALDCALACQGEGHCREAALHSGGIAGPVEIGALCDDLEVCTGQASEDDLSELFDVAGECGSGSGSCQAGNTCLLARRGTLTEAEWNAICTASLLPVDSIICSVWGG